MKQILLSFINSLKETKIVSNFLNLSSIQLSNTILVILIYPIIIRIIGIENFGLVMLSTTFSGLAGGIINYGTSQSSVRDIAFSAENTSSISSVLNNTLAIRFIIFIGFGITIFFLQWFQIRYYNYILLASPLVFAEVLNPLFFFLGVEKLKLYNIANLLSKVFIIALIVLLIKGQEDSKWVNFIMGMVATIAYGSLLLFVIIKHKLHFSLPLKADLLKIAKDNFFLTGNNISVYLQQSLMIFCLAKWGTPLWLGAYSLCDKVIGSSRILIISVSNAIYPKAAQLFQKKIQSWNIYKSQMKKLIACLFLMLSLLLFTAPGFIVNLIAGEKNQTATEFLRIMAFVPTIAALNSLNVLDLLLKNDTISIFRIAMILIVLSMLTAWFLVTRGLYQYFGVYSLLIEGTALLMYEYVIKKSGKEWLNQ